MNKLTENNKIKLNEELLAKNTNLEQKSNISIHLLELKYRFIYLILSFLLSFIVSCNYFNEYLYLLSYFLLDYNKTFVYNTLPEPVFVYFKVTLLFSLFFTFPYFLYTLTTYLSKTKYNVYVTFDYLIMTISGILFLIILTIVGYYVFPTVFKFLITFDLNEQMEETHRFIYLNVEKYINFIFTNVLFVIFFCCIPWIYKSLKINKLLPWGDLTWDVKYFEKRFRYHMYTLAIIATVVVSPPHFLYHFFAVPFSLFFMEIYFLLLWIMAFIKWCLGG